MTHFPRTPDMGRETHQMLDDAERRLNDIKNPKWEESLELMKRLRELPTEGVPAAVLKARDAAVEEGFRCYEEDESVPVIDKSLATLRSLCEGAA